MHFLTRASTAALALLLTGMPSNCLADWELITEQQGVKVSRQVVPGRALPILRGEGEVAGTPYEIIAVLRDFPRQTEWVQDCTESRLLKREGEFTYFYNRTTAPWPVSDRDVVARSKLRVIEAGVEVHSSFEAVSEPIVPERDGVVRMRHLKGQYRIRKMGPASSWVEYELDADPGGSLPGWLVKRTSRERPLRMILGLRARVTATRGQYDAEVRELESYAVPASSE